jgi:hypothetical protein
MDLRTPFRWLGRRDNSKKAADQDNALIDTPEHSDVVEDDDVGLLMGRCLEGFLTARGEVDLHRGRGRPPAPR